MPLSVSVEARSYPEVAPLFFTLIIRPDEPTSHPPLPPPPPPPPHFQAPRDRIRLRHRIVAFMTSSRGWLARAGPDATASVGRGGLRHQVAFRGADFLTCWIHDGSKAP